MALMMLKTRYNEEGFRGFAADPNNRRDAAREGLARLGWKLKEMYFLPSSAEFMVIAEGNPEKAILVEVSAMATGAFSSAVCEIIATPEDFLEQSETAAELAERFDSPNRDEIDRILLDE